MNKKPVLPITTRAERKLLYCAKFACKAIALSLLLIWASSTPIRDNKERPSSALITMGRSGSMFKNVKFHKTDKFPPLYKMKDGIPVKLHAADMPEWLIDLSTWSASRGGPYITALVKTVAPIDADGTKKERIFPNGNLAWELLETIDAQKEFLKLANTTKFGLAVMNKLRCSYISRKRTGVRESFRV